MFDPKTLAWLNERKEKCRLDFFEARKQLEDFCEQFGPLLGEPEYEKEEDRLSMVAHETYVRYKKVWVEWFAAMNGLNIHPSAGRKETRSYGVQVPTRVIIDAVMEDPKM